MSEQNELRRLLEKTRKACSYLKIFCLACCVFVFGVSCLGIVGSILAGDGLPAFLIMLLSQLITLLSLLTLVGILSGPAKGESPFARAQPSRLMLLAGLFVIKFLIDLVAPMAMMYCAPYSFGADFISGVSPGMFLNVNISPLLFSLIMVCLSVVFRYGSLLQRLSDETV